MAQLRFMVTVPGEDGPEQRDMLALLREVEHTADALERLGYGKHRRLAEGLRQAVELCRDGVQGALQMQQHAADQQREGRRKQEIGEAVINLWRLLSEE